MWSVDAVSRKKNRHPKRGAYFALIGVFLEVFKKSTEIRDLTATILRML